MSHAVSRVAIACVAQAKKVPADGSAPTYYISLPMKAKWWSIRARVWRYRRIKAMLAGRNPRIPSLVPFIAFVAAVFTDTGQAWVVDKIQEEPGGVLTLMKYGGWGTGGAAEAVGNTTLTTEAAEARVLGVLSQPAANTDRCVYTLTCNATPKNITETGRFNQIVVAASIMYERALFTAIPMVQNDRIEFTLDVLYKDSSE